MATQSVIHSVEQLKPVVIPFSKPTESEITQLDLAEYILLKRQLREDQEELEAKEAELRLKLEAGAEIEEGIHIARLETRERRNVSWKEIVIRLATRLKLNGEAYCVNVLEHTKPTRTISLVVE